MIAAGQIADLAASLGTLEGLAQVNATVESLNHHLLNHHLIDPEQNFSRDELMEILGALNSLSAALLCMNQATGALLGQTGAGTVNCVG